MGDHKDSSLDHKSVFTTGDEMGKSITSVKLYGGNYLGWCHAVEVFLMGKDKSEHILEEPPSKDSPKYREWARNDAIVLGWLWNSMEPAVARSVQYMKTARLVWTRLKALYSQARNVSRIYDIFDEMFKCRQSGKPLIEYYSLMSGLWDELDIYQPLSTSVEEMQKQREEFRVALFLSNLDSDYRVFKDQILAGDALPTAENSLSRLQRASLGNTDIPSSSQESSVMYSLEGGRGSGGRGGRGGHGGRGSRGGRGDGRGSRSGRGGGGRGRDSNRSEWKCTYCGVSGHTEDSYVWSKRRFVLSNEPTSGIE
ncbi:hypothetical protein BVC80_65g25 [Macleaya cordata]|uniref:Retrotransposon Copia-like N-terminal domain-containing protein n=1 Tax=Macleaya cordata TaxID=56857 RepID=A0A200QWZ9_MACCD|nr:hypothetical protein BVC80_65g25 [Macleaya cordata]